jgi:hypothetical protein
MLELDEGFYTGSTLLNQLITRDLNQTKGTASSSMIDTSQWSLAS